MKKLLLAILIAIPSGIGAMNPVEKACKNGIVKQLLKLVKDVNAPVNTAKEKPLHLAAFYGHAHLVRALLKKGAQVDAVDNDGSTPLRLACQENHYDVARLLLEHHANANSQDTISKQTPLMQAADKGYDALICLLIEYKAHVNMVDRVNATAVWMAALNNNEGAVQILVDAGADLTLKNIQGLTPLAVSIQSGYKGVTEILLRKLRPRAGAVSAQAAAAVAHRNEQQHKTQLCRACFDGDLSQLEQLLAKQIVGINDPVYEEDGSTMLHIAAAKNHLHIVTALFERGARVDSTDQKGETPLIKASAHDHVAMVQLLVKWGADSNAVDGRGMSAMHWACLKKSRAMMRFLLARGTNSNAVDEEGDTPLHYACLMQYEEGVRALLAHPDIDPTKRNKVGLTAFSLAVKRGVQSIIDAFNEYSDRMNEQEVPNADTPHEIGAAALAAALPHLTRQVSQLILNGPDGAGRKLWRACNNGDQRVVAALLREDDVDMQWQHSKTGQTALHVACARGFKDILRLLLLKTSPEDLEVQDIQGHTPLRYSVSADDEEAIRMLIARGANIHAGSCKGVTPVQAARRRGNAGILRLFDAHLENEEGSAAAGAAGATHDE